MGQTTPFRLALNRLFKNRNKLKQTGIFLVLFLTFGFLFQNCGQLSTNLESGQIDIESTEGTPPNSEMEISTFDPTFLSKPFTQVPHGLPSYQTIPSAMISDAVAIENHLVVATAHGLGVSHDNGLTFKTFGIQNGFPSNSFHRVEYNNGNIYAVNGYKSLIVSSDWGETFTSWKGAGPNGRYIELGSNGDFCMTGQNFYLTNGSNRFFASTDAGNSFTEKVLSEAPSIQKILCQGNKIVLIFQRSSNPNAPEKALYGLSYDAGMTFNYRKFSEFDTSLGLSENSELNFVFAQGRLYLHQGVKLFESLDQGGSFNRIYSQNSIRRIARFNTSLIIESNGIAIVSDTSQSLSISNPENNLNAPRFLKGGSRFVAFYPDEKKLLVSSGTDANSASMDTSVGFPDSPLQAADYIDETLFVLGGNGLFKSTDEGQTFSKLNMDCKTDAYRTFGYNSGTAPMAIENKNIYIADSKYICISYDQGETFTKKELQSGIRSFYVKDGQIFALLSSEWFAYSLDDGKTFQYNKIIGFESSIDNSILATTAGIYIASYGKVYFSNDYFATEPLDYNVGGTYSASMYFANNSIYFRVFQSPTNCFKSTLNDFNLTQCNLPANVHFGRRGIYPKIMIGQNKSSGHNLAVSLNGGVDFIYLGTDHGLPESEQRDVVYNEKTNRLFVVTSDGLFRSSQ